MEIIELMQLLGYKPNLSGVCYGIANTIAMANEEGKLSATHKLLDIINKIEISEQEVKEINEELLIEHQAKKDEITNKIKILKKEVKDKNEEISKEEKMDQLELMQRLKDSFENSSIKPLTIAPLIKKILEKNKLSLGWGESQIEDYIEDTAYGIYRSKKNFRI